jgi:hypothetical protein
MKNITVSLSKLMALSIGLLSAACSFAQYNQTSYGGHSPSSYYPHDHDSAVTVMPKLIKTNFIYFGILSPTNQHISAEYDRQMNDDVMLSFQLGLINSGFSQQTNNTEEDDEPTTTVSGGYFEGGVKLFINPDYTRHGRNGYYTVEGLYIKPQIAVSIFSNTTTTTSSNYVYPAQTTTTQYSYTGGALLLNIGGQYIVAHSLAIDLYAGVGVSFSNANSSNNPFTDNYFSYLTTGSNVPLAFTGGINIGLPFSGGDR